MPQSHNPSQIRVALVEDDVYFQSALQSAIEATQDMVLSQVASTCAEALRMLDGRQADVLLVDLGLPDGSGIEVIRAARGQWPTCDIMVSTTFGDELHVMQSLEAGAAGYLLKDSEPEKLVGEIRSLRAGGSPISPLIARNILTRFKQDHAFTLAPVPAKADKPLSAREMEVLELITKGFTADEVAALLFVSRHTVLTFIRRIYAKLQVNSKVEAIYEARKQGLLDA